MHVCVCVLQVDITCVGSVAWGDLCGYLLQQARERELSSIPRGALLDTEPLITHCSHNKVSGLALWLWLCLLLSLCFGLCFT